MEQNIYLQKYLKYKARYLNLKNNVQVGGTYDVSLLLSTIDKHNLVEGKHYTKK